MITWIIPIGIALGISSGPLVARLSQTWLRRLSGFGLLVILITCTHIILTDASPLLRMVGICLVLLACMKGLIYAEWQGPHQLPLRHYLIFSLCWFGMDPGTFQTRRAGLTWKPDLYLGLLMMLIGTLGTWAVWWLSWHQLLLMFIPMSLGFHFGVLRVLKGCLRAAGFPVRTLFPNVLEAQGIADFWGKRWNIGYSQMMQRLVGRPVEHIAGKPASMFAVFVISGILHELAITLPVRSGFGLPTLYFTLHGLLTLIERAIGRPIGKIPSLIAVAAPMGLLFPPAFQNEILIRCLMVFDWLL